jgi:hypothetical protein
LPWSNSKDLSDILDAPRDPSIHRILGKLNKSNSESNEFQIVGRYLTEGTLMGCTGCFIQQVTAAMP